MFDRYLRPVKDRWLAPLARTIGPGVSPGVITWIGFAFGMASAGAVLWKHQYLALVLWLVNRVMDGLDGTHARAHGRDSAFGAYLDILLDFVVYAAIPLALVAVDATGGRAFAGMLMLGAFYVNAASWMYLAALLEQRHEGAVARGESTTVTMPPALIGGTETAAFYITFLVWPTLLVWLFRAMAVLVLINVGVRLSWAKRKL